MELKISDIELVVILVQVNGKPHQVLTSKENKDILITMLSTWDNGLKLDTALAPIEFVKV